MHAQKRGGELAACPPDVERALGQLIECVTGRPRLLEELGLVAACLGSGECLEVLVSRESIVEEALRLWGKVPVFSLGVHSARYCDGRILPLLGLLHVVQGRIAGSYVVVGAQAEKLFMYGRDIFASSVLEEKTGCGDLFVVVNEAGEPLGWARRKGKIYANVLDAGWYLRSGL